MLCVGFGFVSDGGLGGLLRFLPKEIRKMVWRWQDILGGDSWRRRNSFDGFYGGTVWHILKSVL